MIPSGKYPAKILLFGEYSILSGSEALAYPYTKKTGTLKYDCISGIATIDPQKSQKPLIKLYEYLLENVDIFDPSNKPNLPRLRNDLISGLYFDSDIPENYGLGSSGAITAAVYDSYFDQTKQKPFDETIKTLAKIESFYHLHSSGIDPLVSFTGNTIHVVNHNPAKASADLDWVRENLQVYLLDSGKQGATKDGMEGKTAKVTDNEFIELNNSLIRAVIRQQPDQLDAPIKLLCQKQLQLFPNLFTKDVKELAEKGLSSGDFAIKLCGSGGGGYYLLFAFDPNIVEKMDALKQSLLPL